METKRCAACGVEKPRTEFHKKASNKDGLHSYCRPCNAAKMREWIAANRDRFNALQRAAAAKNPKRRRARHHEMYLRHGHKRRAYLAAYQRTHPGWSAAKQNRRRARIRGNGGSYTTAEWQALCKQYGNRCLCCGADGPLTADHIVPISRGGSNGIDNIQPLCFACNRQKATHIIDYRQ